MVGLDKTIIEFQNKIIYILEFHWRKDKIKLSLILCCLDFQHIMFPTIISDCRGRKGGELPFTLVEDFNWKFMVSVDLPNFLESLHMLSLQK